MEDDLVQRIAQPPEIPGAQGQAKQLRLVAVASRDGGLLRLHPAGRLRQAAAGAEDRRGVTTLGMPLGVAVIVFTIIITWIYIRRANSEFDSLTEQIVKGVVK